MELELVFVVPVPLETEILIEGAVVKYKPEYLRMEEADIIFEKLKKMEKYALNETGVMYGKPWTSDRKSLQIGDPGVRRYSYAGASATEVFPFQKFRVVERLRRRILEDTGVYYNFALVNFYPTSADLGYHSDRETDQEEGAPIASLSFGDARHLKFRLKETPRLTVKDFYLESGSLLTMEGDCQKVMEHSLLKAAKNDIIIFDKRVNITLRVMKMAKPKK